ncbi:hypothetical protein PTTG_07769 [Puccinia triticina 1-1 BBBD Race 1]|uniref:DNA 3'-5' helicase n=1 Tax=Puccinia triticina (isolate 1-1 / race 1 (BBBD)) TaxID=630390 RepID=A0A180GA60_PUCT1|nr:hypothetical protein PTTG_07769 [Puccinia triticina 1-1 BBBD Race 1]
MDGSLLVISEQDPADAHITRTTFPLTKAKGKKKPLRLKQDIKNLDNNNLIEYVKDKSKKKYKEAPKKLQEDTGCSLARGYHSFVLAGTGYGKSRITELYFHLYAPQRKKVVLVLNPLDLLGKDQSPEVFLNNEFFTDLYFSNVLQSRLVLIVIDEAHMIYVWALCNWGKLSSCWYGITFKKKKDAYNSKSRLVRRYHACTGDEDKSDCVKAFKIKKFPIFSSTMALGPGQNWKQVQCVICDPSTMSQMMGQCGRDGKPVLVLLLMEPRRKKGKNSVKDLKSRKKQLTDDDRMDAYAVTPACMRVVNAVDNLRSKLPKGSRTSGHLKFDHCKWLNCNPKAAQEIQKLVNLFTKDNFDRILNDPTAIEKITEDLLVHSEGFYNDLMGAKPEFKAARFFGPMRANLVAEALKHINYKPSLIGKLIGGEMFDNQINNMFAFIQAYKKTEWFEQQVFDIEEEKRKTEREKKEKYDKKKRDDEEKQRENKNREAMKLAKQAKDVIALEHFKQIQATKAATNIG